MDAKYKSLFTELLHRNPELEPGFRLIIKRWQSKGAPPRQISTPVSDSNLPNASRGWEQLGKVKSLDNGKLRFILGDALRQEAALNALANVLNIDLDAEKRTEKEWLLIIQRLRLAFNSLAVENDWLSNSKSVRDFAVETHENSQQLFHLMQTVEHLCSGNHNITLSDLGAQFFNDSKILRHGFLNRLLQQLLCIHIGDDRFVSIDNILKQFGVISNLYAATALIHGPLRYRVENTWYDWVSDLNDLGQSALLTWEQVQTWTEIDLSNSTIIITSENLAPYQHLAANGATELIIYTEGYPNSAVCRLLELLGKKSYEVLHWGDTDLDGWLITERIFKHIKGKVHPSMEPDTATSPEKLKVYTPEQLSRAKKYLEQHEDALFRNEIQYSMKQGWTEQESMIIEQSSPTG